MWCVMISDTCLVIPWSASQAWRRPSRKIMIALSQSVECIGKLEDKLIKEIHARRSMRDNLLASVVAETSSRTEP